MKTNVRLWSYLAQFFLDWEIFQTKAVEKTKRIISFNKISPKSCRLWDNVEKYGTAGQDTDVNTGSFKKIWTI